MSYVVDILKTAHIKCNSSRRFSNEDLVKAVDYAFPKRRSKQSKSKKKKFKVLSGKVMSKKFKQSAETAHKDFMIDWGSPEFRGHLLIRFLYVSKDDVYYDYFSIVEKTNKEINRICMNIGINFPKKTPNEAYQGAFKRIFDDLLAMIDEPLFEVLKEKVEAHFPDFEIKISDEDYGAIKRVVDTVLENVDMIYNSQVNFMDGYKEIDAGYKIDFEDLSQVGVPLIKMLENEKEQQQDEGELNFDIFDINHEYVTIEDSDSGILVKRGIRKNAYESKYNQKVSTETGTLATKEDVEKLQKEKEKNFVVMDKKGDRDLIENAEAKKVDKSDPMIKQFYKKFEKDLTKNAYWQMNLFDILDKLSDKSKSSDQLFDVILGLVDSNFEMVTFLFEHREALVKEFMDTKDNIESNERDKRQKRQRTNIMGGSSGIRKRRRKKDKYGTEETALTNHQVLSMLGMADEDIETERKLGLKAKNVDLSNKILLGIEEEELDEEEMEILDYVNIHTADVRKQLGSRYKRIDMPEYLTFDCNPQPRVVPHSEEELFKIIQLPEHLQAVFKGITHLNQLQTSVRQIAYETDESMLVCAPTGAGKTNVALLTILREVSKTYDFETGKCGDFKIVYISPLKALATEVVDKFGKKLNYLGVNVREYTGDVGLTRQELQETHIIVATPEKWDVMTRKSNAVAEMVGLIIIDEIHLLDEERGRVLECIIARTLMNSERSQKRIRLLGLSATLPNYVEVARFMRVKKGLFYFSEAYRPVPLFKKFIGCRKPKMPKKYGGAQGREGDNGKKQQKSQRQRYRSDRDVMNEVCYDIVRDNLLSGEQILVFVHSRRETVSMGKFMLQRAEEKGELGLFVRNDGAPVIKAHLLINKDIRELVKRAVGSHNAGLSRRDRRTIENGFLAGSLRVVICTATLAWGVNLPAHAVIIKGTDVYRPGQGWVDLSILDVQQIFGRAGRPQFDEYGEATLITKIDRLNHFMGMMSCKLPIDSNFESCMMEASNAEVALGNLTSLTEVYEYVKRTFYYVRACKNPRLIGCNKKHEVDGKLLEIVERNVNQLHKLRMVRYDQISGMLESTELGRIASHYYINCGTMERFCTYLNFYEDDDNIGYSNLNVNIAGDIEDQNLLAILAQASEFKDLQVRPDESGELKQLRRMEFLESVNHEFLRMVSKKKEMDVRVKANQNQDDDALDAGNVIDSYQKVLLLIQGYLSLASYNTYSLVADTNYIVQNGTRILRCIFEICLRKNLAYLSMTVLRWCRYIENCVRDDLTPLRMFCFENVKRGILSIRKGHPIKRNGQFIEDLTCKKVERWMDSVPDEYYYNYGGLKHLREEGDLTYIFKLSKQEGSRLNRALKFYPILDIEYSVKPVAQTILKVDVVVVPDFLHSKQFHMGKEQFWLIVEDGKGEILHNEQFGVMTRNLQYNKKISPIELSFFLPFKGTDYDYKMIIMSDRFVGCDKEITLDLSEVMIHTEKMEYTDLLNLRPLPISTLNNKDFEDIYSHISFFNPIQTQVFFALYHTDNNCIIGAPTGSGKTIISELAVLRIFKENPNGKVVYIAPYKALAKERIRDWRKRFQKNKRLNKKVLELTGDYTPDLEALISSNILVTTPEKWDGVSRNWQQRNYVTQVSLIIFDEIHLLGQDRGIFWFNSNRSRN